LELKVNSAELDDFGASEVLPRVLVVDDDPLNLELLTSFLRAEQYQISTVQSGQEAIAAIQANPPDLVLLDVMMPGLDGFDVCTHIKSNSATRLIRVLMVTALTAREDRIRGLALGVDDFLSKPVDRLELVTRCRSLTRAKRFTDELESTKYVILALARAIEARDGYTEQHTERVAARAVALGERLGLSSNALHVLQRGCMLHDVGKIGISESILGKPSSLTGDEFALMREHPVKGVAICRPLRSRLIAQALPIVRHHHERIDGAGYPDGLKGTDIPLGARIAAIADAYDAMVSDRPYRMGMSPARALDVLRAGAGTQWDAQLVAAFVELDARILDAGLVPDEGAAGEML
jgi:putative two-component system response regulator